MQQRRGCLSAFSPAWSSAFFGSSLVGATDLARASSVPLQIESSGLGRLRLFLISTTKGLWVDVMIIRLQ
jgi:hypothetical protein